MGAIMSSNGVSPRFRYMAKGADGAEGTIVIRNGEWLAVTWPGEGHSPDENVFPGSERLGGLCKTVFEEF